MLENACQARKCKDVHRLVKTYRFEFLDCRFAYSNIKVLELSPNPIGNLLFKELEVVDDDDDDVPVEPPQPTDEWAATIAQLQNELIRQFGPSVVPSSGNEVP